MASIEEIKKLREETDLPISDCRKALEEARGDIAKAKSILEKLGREFVKKREEREAKAGIVDAYIHGGRKIGAIIQLHCESDFVARSEEFKKLAHELCLQIAAVSPEETPLLEQPWIKDQDKTVKDLISDYSAKFGEKIVLEKYARYQL